VDQVQKQDKVNDEGHIQYYMSFSWQ